MNEILLVVHPDVLCEEYHTSPQWNPEHLEFLADEVWNWEGPVAAIFDRLLDHQAEYYPDVNALFVHIQVLIRASNKDLELELALVELIKNLHLEDKAVTVTGIWAGPGGAVDNVYNFLKTKIKNVKVSSYAIRKTSV
jgi:hypothetical protein